MKFKLKIKQSVLQPPIQVFGIEGRYAHAIYSAASKEKKLEKVEAELGQVDQLIKNTSKLSEFILNPTLDKQKKQSKSGRLYNGFRHETPHPLMQ